ncbi:uncharacterized protein ASCRUDRAFT_74008 [Ascoidea rubescens DSM 1968]|uniref:PH domain-containing protein n=1 Tax=Ascoidea rubescens DSM 1968 TaxID=1344418 RepID=A0A1D2VS08_9ASCO|nr:hypothetical protein ASCRUDRAFT_74008 [Ascoidea rubescens DSM 1968]ODV64368.1 hypothetical protein ASCRUDRAFT_74008 [Ascoidea rubescens DSM 1968]
MFNNDTDISLNNIKKNYFSNGINKLNKNLNNYHKNQSKIYHENYKTISKILIPNLNNLNEIISMKIKEIKILSNDFANHNINREIALTGQRLTDYLSSIFELKTNKIILKNNKNNNSNDKTSLSTGHQKSVSSTSLKSFSSLSSSTDEIDNINIIGKDPYLLKLNLDLQLKNQILEENYLIEAYENIQKNGSELDRIIFQEIQDNLNLYLTLIENNNNNNNNNNANANSNANANANSNGDLRFLIDIINQDSYCEWNEFINKDGNKNFISNFNRPRNLGDIYYPFNDCILSKSIKMGFLLKKSKVFNKYNKYYYVLTLNYLHEFKSNNLIDDNTPIYSLKLNNCFISEFDKISKFILVYKNPLSKKIQKIIFKTEDKVELFKWYNDLNKLLSFPSSIERGLYIESKLADVSKHNEISNNDADAAGTGSVAPIQINVSHSDNDPVPSSSNNSFDNSDAGPATQPSSPLLAPAQKPPLRFSYSAGRIGSTTAGLSLQNSALNLSADDLYLNK